MTDTVGNRFKDEFAGSFQGLDGQYRRYQNGRKIEKQQAKILSKYYVHERTMSNSFINNYGANASMYGGRAAEYQRIARKAGLKG